MLRPRSQAGCLRRGLRDRRRVSEPAPLLDREGIEEAFRRLGDRLAKRGVVADIYVFGGAAMALAYDSRRATRDVDALFKPHGIVLEEAQAVAAELGLPNWWLNEQASSYAAPSGDPSASSVFDHPGLRVFAASPGTSARDEGARRSTSRRTRHQAAHRGARPAHRRRGPRTGTRCFPGRETTARLRLLPRGHFRSENLSNLPAA